MVALQVYPSVPNVLEALKHPNGEVRRDLLSALRRWLAERPLLPWPAELLRLAGEAIARGQVQFTIRSESLDQLVERPRELKADRERAERFLADVEKNFREQFDELRPHVQREIKAQGLRDRWPTLRAYLEEEWSNEDVLDHFATIMWKGAGVACAKPHIRQILSSEPWRIALECIGAAMYYRAVVHEQQRNPAGFVDLSQLVYVSAHTRSRIFVTDDASLYESASGILVGRYPNVRVARARDLLPSTAA